MWKARSPCAKPSLMKGRSTRYSSSLRWKKAQTCRERSRTEPASRTCFAWLIVLSPFWSPAGNTTQRTTERKQDEIRRLVSRSPAPCSGRGRGAGRSLSQDCQFRTGREGLHGQDDIGGAGEPLLAVLGQHALQDDGESFGYVGPA